MTESSQVSWDAIAYSFTFILSIVMLAVLVSIPFQCGQLAVSGNGNSSCGVEPGWYFFCAAMILTALYSAYKMFAPRRIYPENSES
jgi:uncharacterized membrane protein (DUF485 family)